MTQEERQALRNWEEFHKAFNSDMPVDNGLTRHDIEKRKKQLEKDPVAWIKYFFPKYAKYLLFPFNNPCYNSLLITSIYIKNYYNMILQILQ